MEKEYRKITELHNWERNPRSIKAKDFERLKKQIQLLGMYKPLLITADGTVLGGNMRLRAYVALGLQDIWVSVVDAPTEEKKLEYALSDNDRAGYYDADLIANLIPDFPEFKWDEYAVDLREPQTLQELIDNLAPTIEDEPPAVADGESISKYGEVYQLGRHRLMCGDATKPEDMDTLMAGAKADMVFTDPPYNIDFGYKEYNDNKSKEEYKQFCQDWFNLFSMYPLIFTPGPRNINLYPEPTDIGTWVKRGGKSGASVFNLRFCEPILFYGKFKNKRPTDLFEYNSGDYRELDSSRLSLGIDIRKESREYAPAKPLKLIADIVKSFSEKDNLIVDCFGGNGTTLIACEQTNRTCYMMELDPKYCDVIRKRYDNFVASKQAKTDNGKN